MRTKTLIEQAKELRPDLSSTHLDDLRFVDMTRSGNSEEINSGFKGIYDKYYPLILNKMLLGTNFDMDLSKDLTMDVMVKMLENLDKYEFKATFNAWITSVAKNTMINYFNSFKLKKNDAIELRIGVFENESEDSVYLVQVENMSSDSNSDVLAMGNEIDDKVNELLDKLSSNQKLAIKLVEMEGYKYDEAASIMGIGLSNFKITLFRAKNELKDMLLKSGMGSYVPGLNLNKK